MVSLLLFPKMIAMGLCFYLLLLFTTETMSLDSRHKLNSKLLTLRHSITDPYLILPAYAYVCSHSKVMSEHACIDH